MRRRRRGKSAPRAGDALVEALFKRVKLDGKAREWRALHAWHVAAGPRIANRIRAERILGSAMMLRVASSAWANEFSYLRAGLLERLRETPGGEWVADLRVTVGPLEDAPDFSDGEPRLPPKPRVEPPRVDDGAVAGSLREIADPELRAALAELYARARHGL